MSILDEISRKPIQPNDPRGWSGYEVNGEVRQPQRTAERDSLVIAGLQAGIVYELDMHNYLGHDLLVTGLSSDIVGDDGKQLQPGDQRPNYTSVQIIIQLVDRSNKHIQREIVLVTSSYGGNIQNELILSANGLYRIKLNQDVNDISIVGKPVVLGETKIAFNLPVIEPEQASRGIK